MTSHRPPPWDDNAYIARVLHSGWAEVATAFDGKVMRYHFHAEDSGLPITAIFAKQTGDIPAKRWTAWFPRSSPLLDVPPQFGKTRGEAAGRLIRSALDEVPTKSTP